MSPTGSEFHAQRAATSFAEPRHLASGLGGLAPWLVPLAAVVGVTFALDALQDLADFRHVAICYLMPVVLAATRWGGWSAAWTVALSAGAIAYFLYPPIYSLRVDSEHQVLDLAMFAVVAAVMAYLGVGIRANARAAKAREAEIEALHRFSQRLAVSSNSADIYAAIEDHLSAVTGRRVVIVNSAYASVPDIIPASVQSAIQAGFQAPAPAGDVSLATLGAGWMLRPLLQKSAQLGIVAVELGEGDERGRRATVRRVNTALDEAAATLERINVANALSEAQLRTQTETLRQALIGSVSHELCTPLASILGAASILAEARPVTENTQLRTLAMVVRDEAERLNADIQTLLDASRISSNSVSVRLAWTDVTDVVNAAVERRRKRLSHYDLSVDMPPDLPLVKVDSALIEQALGQILDNAGKYSPAGSRIDVTVRREGGSLAIAVRDRGIGMAPDELDRIWERFYRSPRSAASVAGSGLGLWVARSLANATGASIEAWSAGPDQGSVLTIKLPVTDEGVGSGEGQTDDEAGRSGH